MKQYFETIKNALIEADKADNNWAWYPVKYGDTVEFRWGYFDYLEDERNFVLAVYEVEDNDIVVEVLIPSGASIYVLVGKNFWDDCQTVEKGINKAQQKLIKKFVKDA